MLRADVAVYGGTAAGVLAAVAAARRGAHVVLLEPGRHLGGMVSGGLGWTDTGNAAVVGGLALAFHERVAAMYGVPLWHHPGPEPHVAETIFEELAAEPGIDLRREQRLAGVRRTAAAIQALDTEAGLSVEAAVFVDAGYEGDLLAAAGLPYRVGRESRALHGERFAGRQARRSARFAHRVGSLADSRAPLPE
jgi:glycine/D-amino acid oxidase-like deaminating enzyme